jgi:16S rRNA (guanine(966)-N(2))-methyltransferase RsmD
MRIIAGDYKGRRLKAPTWPGLRPTSDKLRETLFNVIAARIPAARVLDVFAGTGAIGLESLSRGAGRVVFIDADRRAAALIAENAERCGVTDRCAIIRDTAERALAGVIAGGPFDVVMLDPPYDFEPLADVLGAATRQVAPDGLLVLEHASRRTAPTVAGAHATRTIRSGDSALTLFAISIPVARSSDR